MDIKETKELIKFGLLLAKAIQESTEDGKITLTDGFKFIPSLKAVKDAIEGAQKIPAELNDLDEAERLSLLEYFKAEFDLEDDVLEKRIEEGLEVALGLLKLATSFAK